MKKVFLTMMMLLFAVTGVMRADEVTIGSGTVSYYTVPVNMYYNYSLTEQIYTADEIGMAGMINSISFDYANTSAFSMSNVTLYMKNVSRSTFATTTDMEPLTTDDIVWNGTFTATGAGWVTIILDTPFFYNGVDNLLVAGFDGTSGYPGSAFKFNTNSTADKKAIAYYSDSYTPDPYNNSSFSGSKTTLSYRNNIKLEISALTGAAITINPATLDLGMRPNGAWMAPFSFEIQNSGSPAAVTGVEFNNNFFTANGEFPTVVTSSSPLTVGVSTGETTPGPVNADMLVLFNDGRNFETFSITAEAYDPVDGDVWENAIDYTGLDPRTDYATYLPTGIYKNYNLPDGTTAVDGVFQVSFDEDVLFYAATESGSTFIYTEDFEEVGGPDVDNNYEYNGPQVNPGPVSMWFSYDHSGSYTAFGYNTAGTLIYGYEIPAATLQDLGLGNCAITEIESALLNYGGTYCDFFILKGGDTPDLNNLVYEQEVEDFQLGYIFDLSLDEPQFLGDDENLWIMFMTDNTRAYCGTNPVDPNGKIWYTRNGTTWYNSTNCTPFIFTHFIELPTGRETTLNTADLKLREIQVSENSELTAIDANVNGYSRAQKHIAAMGNRPSLQNVVYDFDDNTIPSAFTNTSSYPWTAEPGYYSYCMKSGNAGQASSTSEISLSFTYPSNGTFSFDAECMGEGSSTAWDKCIFEIDGVQQFQYGAHVSGWNNYSYEITAGAHTFTWKYSKDSSVNPAGDYFAVDNVTLTYMGGDEPGGDEPIAPYEPYVPTFTADIDGMYLTAGTYYVVAASDVAGAEVNMAYADIPAPEVPLIITPDPVVGEQNVSAPYLLEWQLGDYTAEMQVLVGTQYPPTDVLIDWTDELVESVFVTELENNMSYKVMVKARNAAGTVKSEVAFFTTAIDPVEGFEGAESYLYPGDAAEFTWDANRSLKGYNLYYDNLSTGETVKVNEDPITANEYAVEGLGYNNEDMGGYEFYVKALYDAGESEASDSFMVYMTGTTTITGTVYDQDSITVIPNAAIEFRGVDEWGADQVISCTADENGEYTCEVLVGQFTPYVVSAAYAPDYPAADEVTVVYDTPQVVDLYTHEFYFPVGMVTATEQPEDNNVLVEWAWTPADLVVDFETGDFSQAEFTLPATYPWAITTTNPHEGTYCMKSTCEGVASGTSSIEATVEVPFDAKMGFWVRVSSEASYDKFHFYIDGIEQGSALSGQLAYAYKEYSVEAGTHTYKWEYGKDSSVNSNDDCVYVDDITMYRQDVPAPPIVGATVYDFEDETMMGWTSLDANNDGYGWVSSSDPGQYHNSGVTLAGTGHNSSQGYVLSGSYSNSAGIALNPDNYLVAPTQISAEAGAQIVFYACAQDASWAAEHFGVAVSTTTATASAFTTVQDWTLTAKGPQGTTAENARDIRGTRAQGAWYSYTVDLSAYAGQDIWVAIRHFNCTDQFILNVDDITLADGSAKQLTRNDRTFQGFNLYRRDVKNGEDVADIELIATPAADVFEYTDNDWANLEYGMWQWGVQATYEGNAPERNREEVTYDFDDNTTMGWTSIDGDADGYDWVLGSEIGGVYLVSGASLAGSGHESSADMMCSGSYSNVTGVGALTPNNFLVSPAKGAYSQISFWACGQDASWVAEHFSVEVATAAAPTSADFTTVQEWTMTSKGAGAQSIGRDGQTRAQGSWHQYTADLSAYAGTEIWVAIRHFNCTDMFILDVDDITLTSSSAPGPGPGPGPAPAPAGSGLSEIVWSNILEKDMISTVTVNVALNNNQDPTGAVVTFEGPETYTATVDATGVVTFENFRKGDYVFNVELDTYYLDPAFVHDVTIDEDEMTFDVVLYEYILPVEDLYVSPTGWAMWSGATAGTTPTPGPGPVGPTTTWSDDFEDGSISNWTTIDADGDGDTWQNATPAAYGIGDAHSGTNCASSWSWNSYSMDPDNYLISPLSEGATNITYYVATNTAYPDHYGIAVSSTGTNASDFTIVFEENAGSKGLSGKKSTMTFNGGNREMSAWIEKSVELPAGTKYVAFRHWDSYDMNYLFIDDVTITMGGAKSDRAPLLYKVKLDGKFEGETENPYFQHNVEGFEAGSEHVTSVAALYATGLGDWVDYTWTYTPCEEYGGVTNYTATAEGNNVTLNWTLNATPGPGPGPTPPPTGGWTEDFEGGALPTGWTTIDADGDGSNWVLASVAMGAGYGHNGSSDMILSKSYDNSTGALTPNNYLVTAQVTPTAGSTFSFYACAQDASWAGEHFGVAVSTGSQTVAADFTMVDEWTMTAKGSGVMVPGRDGQLRAQGNWYEYTVDLSAYAGQPIYIAIRHFNCTDFFYLDVDDVTFTTSAKSNRNMWDLVYEFDATSGYQYGVASDGTNIYTSSWSASSTSMFYKYDMEGNFIEEFDISGCGQLRGMTYDGQYFYGVANAATIYCVDLANHTLISSTPSTYGAMRCITYDPERDGFWVVGNWSGNLTLVDRSGAVVQTGPAPTSASDVAYYKDPDGVEHVYCFNNASNEVQDYNIGTNTIASAPAYTVAGGAITGSSGGCFVGTYGDKTCFFADVQQSPQHIAIYELDANVTPGPGPGPTPTPGDVLGVYVFRDGELISGTTPLTANTFTDSNVEAGTYEYCVRVVYSDYAMSCPECETVTIGEVSCDPVTNLTATQTENPTYGMGILLEWEGHANSYKVYEGGVLQGQVSGTSCFFYNMDDGEYTFGIVAVYTSPACESEMVTVTITYDAIGENEIVNNLYPNPTNDKVTIEAEGMNHITVATALGQVVYDADVDADMIELNLGQYNAGMYLVRVSTINGVTVKRVTVVK